MAFERLRTNAQTDLFLGKPAGQGSDDPWVPSTPKQNVRTEIKRKAEQVVAGQAEWTKRERDLALAELILSLG